MLKTQLGTTRNCAQSRTLSIQFTLAINPFISEVDSRRGKKANKKEKIPPRYPQSILINNKEGVCTTHAFQRLIGIESYSMAIYVEWVGTNVWKKENVWPMLRMSFRAGQSFLVVKLCKHIWDGTIHVKSPGYQSPSQIFRSLLRRSPTQALPLRTISLPPLAFPQHQNYRPDLSDHSRSPRPFLGRNDKP